MAIIILEGIDKVGKSTLANKLCFEFKAEYVKFSAPKGNAFIEYMNFLNTANKNKTYVLDRFHIGECVYGPIYRQRNDLCDGNFSYLETQILQHNGVCIYCWNSYDIIKTNFVKDNENFTKTDDIREIRKSYEKWLEKSMLPTLRYNYNMTNYEEFVTTIRLYQELMKGNKYGK